MAYGLSLHYFTPLGRSKSLCLHQHRGLTCWLRPCAERWFELARLQLTWADIAYTDVCTRLYFPIFALSTFPPNKRVIRLAQRRTLSLLVCLQTKNAQTGFLSDTRLTGPCSRVKLSRAWHTNYVIAATYTWRDPRKLRFGLKTSFYLHIGWSLGHTTDTFLLKWSSSKRSIVYADAPFPLKS